MLVDSHCHINFPELAGDLEGVLSRMRAAGVTHALCVSVSLETFPQVLAIAERFDNVYASVGVHPNEHGGEEPTPEKLCELASHPRVIAIGETGLDYYRESGDLGWQRERAAPVSVTLFTLATPYFHRGRNCSLTCGTRTRPR